MSGADLLMLAPWLLFGAGLAVIGYALLGRRRRAPGRRPPARRAPPERGHRHRDGSR